MTTRSWRETPKMQFFPVERKCPACKVWHLVEREHLCAAGSRRGAPPEHFNCRSEPTYGSADPLRPSRPFSYRPFEFEGVAGASDDMIAALRAAMRSARK